MSKHQEKLMARRRDALRAHLRASPGNADPASLARSYALPQPEVEAIIRSTKYA